MFQKNLKTFFSNLKKNIKMNNQSQQKIATNEHGIDGLFVDLDLLNGKVLHLSINMKRLLKMGDIVMFKNYKNLIIVTY